MIEIRSGDLISILIKDKDIEALSEKQIIFFVQTLMRSSFWTANLKVIHKVIREVSPLIIVFQISNFMYL